MTELQRRYPCFTVKSRAGRRHWRAKSGLYLEVNGLQELVSRHVGVLGLGRISIAQEDVMQPVRHDCVLVHQVTNAFQHCLEVVFLQQPSGNSLGSQKMLADNNDPCQ